MTANMQESMMQQSMMMSGVGNGAQPPVDDALMSSFFGDQTRVQFIEMQKEMNNQINQIDRLNSQLSKERQKVK